MIQHLQDFETVNLLWKKCFAHFSEDLQRLTFQEKNQRLLQSIGISASGYSPVTDLLFKKLCSQAPGSPYFPIRTVLKGHSLGRNPVLTLPLPLCLAVSQVLGSFCKPIIWSISGSHISIYTNVDTHSKVPLCWAISLHFVRDMVRNPLLKWMTFILMVSDSMLASR